MKKGKTILITIAAVVVLGLGVGIWLGWSGSSKEIEGVANQFRADSSWELKNNTVRPPRALCIDVKCPEVSRTWLTKKFINKDELVSLLSKSGWDEVKLEDPDCFEKILAVPNNSSCSAYGSVGKYKVQIYVSNNDNIYNEPSLSFFIQE